MLRALGSFLTMVETTSGNRMNIADLLCYLREQFLTARTAQDHDALIELSKVVDSVLEAAYQSRDREVAALLQEFEASIRDSLTRVEWKSTIPTVEDIRRLGNT